MVRVIARIPDVTRRADDGVPPTARAPARRPPRPRDRRLTDRVAVSWPSWSLAALAVVAVVVWMMASWNDQARLRMQRGETRLAREPAAAPAAPGSGARGAGAVVR